MSEPKENTLYYGDNLEVLRDYIADKSVDLVYLDPPFKSDQNYNVLFAEHDGTKSAAQILAFEDTWEWNTDAEKAYELMVEFGGRLSSVMRAFRTFLGSSDMMAYLAMMGPRLVELRRVLKDSGSLYLHCDPTASHYLKMLLDAVFGPQQFKNEIIWRRTASHNSAKRFGPVHDIVYYYTKTETPVWNQQCQPYIESYKARFKKIDDKTGLPFQDVNLTGPGVRTGASGQPWGGFNPTAIGRHWQPASYVYKKYEELAGEELSKYPLLKRLDKLDEVGLIFWPEKKGGRPRYKQFLADARGVPLQDVWTDIDAINSQAQERLGYPTQKPQSLLERIILSSTKEGDLVLDPFCGCGTAIEAAHHLKRRWIGIDITHLAIGLIKYRLQNAFNDPVRETYDVIGEPVTVQDACQLAEEDPFQFQCWALGLVGARSSDQQKGADRGIDGRLYFHDERAGATKQIVFSVKSGVHLSPAFVRELRGVLDREKAQIGVLITLHRPTREMLKESTSCGFYQSTWGKHPRLQILTVEQLLSGETINRPPTREVDVTMKKRPRSAEKQPEQLRLPRSGQ